MLSDDTGCVAFSRTNVGARGLYIGPLPGLRHEFLDAVDALAQSVVRVEVSAASEHEYLAGVGQCAVAEARLAEACGVDPLPGAGERTEGVYILGNATGNAPDQVESVAYYCESCLLTGLWVPSNRREDRPIYCVVL